ncbi:hypothetical protein O7602_05665 [Micromonospora sp. WMMD1128]|uniref:type IV toxin-antitoxin system AbiEi family antitoxin domain-containing protein n=1 Tax=unclassified Micromonospora TaxID=2617518 RepID=UPI00248C8539|nr:MULTISPECIES: type IV toxin-antitoxin system AbiEi family antitoxin domain-containing protein [unclassified Micromonospora]WBB75018.1 hypothetical protein O7602_05665 [Micromonospora sp. WMMD1128]WFE31607.1 hypothetical protein O7613_18525 [Micromonospora sp. WMMD975]
MVDHPPRLADIAHRQQDLVTRVQLLQAGYDDMFIYRQTRRGRWQRVLPATYALVTGVLTDEQRRISAALYAGRGAQLTGLSALSWYGFRYSPRTTDVHLLVPHSTSRKSTGHVLVSRALSLDPNARATAHYPVCSPARSVVDAARDLRDLRTVRAIVAEAVQRSFTDLAALDEEIIRARRSRTALIRKAFHEVTAGARSAPEAELRDCLAGSRLLPEILWNPRLTTGDGCTLPTPDGYLAESALALEVDSREYHLSPDGWARTLDRHNELSRLGVMTLHFTPAQIRREPRRVRRTVEQAHASRPGLAAAVAVQAAPAAGC